MSEEAVCYAQSSRGAALTWTTLAFFAGFAGVSAFGPIVTKLKQSMALSPLLMKRKILFSFLMEMPKEILG